MAWWEGEDIDSDSNISHMVKAMACMCIVRDAQMRGKLTDDRPPKTPDGWVAEMNERSKELLDKFPEPLPPYTEKQLYEEPSDEVPVLIRNESVLPRERGYAMHNVFAQLYGGKIVPLAKFMKQGKLATVEQIVSEASDPINKEKLVQIITSEIKNVEPKIAERYIVFEGEQNYKPIIILLAGVPGIGKSTLASQLSQRLEITNIIGTDMIREVLRQTISSKLIPELHSSSYEAYKMLKPKLNPILRQSIVGYEEQCRHIIVGV